jgi:hypothetical protein
MLFDLRGRHRRRAVRVIYVGLAALIGVGLVGFGIGGGLGGGGIFSAASSGTGSGSTSFAAEVKKYRKETVAQPQNLAPWEGLTKALLHEGGGEAYVNQSTGAVTEKGKKLFKEASEAWSGYLALNPAKPSAELAQLVVRIYAEEGLNEPAKAVEALQIIVAARPNSAALYAQLAEYAYKAKNERVGDLASEKAVSLAPAADRATVKSELAAIKKNPSGGGQTYTTTTNGKTYALKKTPSGTYTGTQINVTPSPATTGTTTTGTTTTPAKTTTSKK